MLNSNLLRLAVASTICTPFLAIADITECTNGGMSRTVEVVYSDPGHPVPCEVLYNKPNEGTQESLWQANNQAGYCEERAREFIVRLGELGWACGESSMESASEPVPEEAEELVGEEPETSDD